jgi:hypothetical protein
VFELNRGGHHDHLVCIQCGHVEEFFDSKSRNASSRWPRIAASTYTSIRCRSMRTVSRPTAPIGPNLEQALAKSCGRACIRACPSISARASRRLGDLDSAQHSGDLGYALIPVSTLTLLTIAPSSSRLATCHC